MFKMWKNKEHEIVLSHMNTNILCKYMIWDIMCPYAFTTMGNHDFMFKSIQNGLGVEYTHNKGGF
jgi:hypothetical protein